MLRESLPQYVQGARLLCDARDGTLGFPATQLLLTVVDSIGSYYCGRSVVINGQSVRIRRASQYIYVLNSNYFGCEFSKPFMDEIYSRCRCLLTHNAAIAPGVVLVNGYHRSKAAFVDGRDGYLQVFIRGLLNLCEQAVDRFLSEVDEVVPASRAAVEIGAKDRSRTHPLPRRGR